jgi:hypothetical protein
MFELKVTYLRLRPNIDSLLQSIKPHGSKPSKVIFNIFKNIFNFI